MVCKAKYRIVAYRPFAYRVERNTPLQTCTKMGRGGGGVLSQYAQLYGTITGDSG